MAEKKEKKKAKESKKEKDQETKENQQETQTGEKSESSRQKNVFEELGDSVGKFATKTVETIRHTLEDTLSSRNKVMTIRVNDDANKKLNMLVNAGIFKSRSESAAFLIEEGIKHQEKLFDRISEKMETIDKLKDELKDIVTDEMSQGKKK
jgi:Arc/MetJ-type ribon-helix-helix transcriptional regulator